MRQIRETWRQYLRAGLIYNQVGRALKFSKNAAAKYVSPTHVAGVDWEVAQTLSKRCANPIFAANPEPTGHRQGRRPPAAVPPDRNLRPLRLSPDTSSPEDGLCLAKGRAYGPTRLASLLIPRSSMAQWLGICGVRLASLAAALKDLILGHDVLHADRT